MLIQFVHFVHCVLIGKVENDFFLLQASTWFNPNTTFSVEKIKSVAVRTSKLKSLTTQLSVSDYY